ncbi:MAG TPA: zinc-ribbon domain-containing protein, partial [Variovorax sp.]|nr:zinc-ribbon domain-containing protein [Variovorax sp.]
MRLVTRCPACATTFKVVRDQLRISDGWVRCGRCSEVFDATLDLQETDDDGVPLTTGAASSAPQPASPRPPQENMLPPSSGA